MFPVRELQAHKPEFGIIIVKINQIGNLNDAEKF